MKAFIITIGDELLIGQVLDTNAAWMGQQLNEIGIPVVERITVGDSLQSIVDAIHFGITKADIILLTGGLGPTRDDITKMAIADYLKVEMEFHTETWKRIKSIFIKLEKTTTKAHKEQCYMPKGTHFLFNKMGTAPGMLYKKDGATIISMPGVPYEMMSIMQDEVLPLLSGENKDHAIVHTTIQTAGEGESRIADKIQQVIDTFPPHITIAYLPNLGKVRLRITAHGQVKSHLQSEVDKIVNEIKKLLGPLVFGFGNTTLESKVGEILRDKGLKIGTAESCTGGHLAHLITSIPNASDYYLGSIVAYSNRVKEEVLLVDKKQLSEYGAVSEPTVCSMLKGLLQKLPVNVGLAVSGIAGPGGGTPDKPVGTIWIACGNQHKVDTKKLSLGKDRLKNIEYTSIYALNMMRLFLIENYT